MIIVMMMVVVVVILTTTDIMSNNDCFMIVPTRMVLLTMTMTMTMAIILMRTMRTTTISYHQLFATRRKPRRWPQDKAQHP